MYPIRVKKNIIIPAARLALKNLLPFGLWVNLLLLKIKVLTTVEVIIIYNRIRTISCLFTLPPPLFLAKRCMLYIDN